ncbi:DUF6101 family protein [Ancylobacter sp. G4_0304]|uniref:DUF6101 family protein n=1 Tax=Ancylobacter sp. G4_0304 TaxID=3114289 RepID=UPI0039C6A77C
MRRQFAVEACPPVPAYPYVALDRPSAPEGWPLVFQSLDPNADAGARLVELHPTRIVLRRRLSGVPMRIEMELSRYEGVAVALLDPEGEDDGVAVVLVHADPGLSVTLYSAPGIDDVVAQWRGWSGALGLPMLVTGEDGTRRPAYPMLGRLVVSAAKLRRRRRGGLKHRRPSVFQRRSLGRPPLNPSVHRGEREMFARD